MLKCDSRGIMIEGYNAQFFQAVLVNWTAVVWYRIVQQRRARGRPTLYSTAALKAQTLLSHNCMIRSQRISNATPLTTSHIKREWSKHHKRTFEAVNIIIWLGTPTLKVNVNIPRFIQSKCVINVFWNVWIVRLNYVCVCGSFVCRLAAINL